MKLSHTFLFVHDQDAALKFYRDVIGLEVRTDQTIENDYRWLTVGPADQPGVEIGLARVGPPVPPTDFEVLEALLAKGSLQGLIFVVEDVDAKFEQVRAAGGEVLQEPVDQYYGVRDCAFRDPSGNSIRFSSQR
ncbi:VOC family protein [Lentzea sp. NPDC058436]|uniref:VOC family protein n=1 Tax=Lentzea sp. NPDC058436 TaxID=3346499 RepID=UPI00365B4597